MAGEKRLRRVLGPVGLTSLGVGAIIGTGIFVLIGEVVHEKTGPAVMVSFLVAALACVFAGLCYAEFAAMVPVAGSAYTYAYATLGELIAWIIGWDLVLEYAVSGSAVAVGWSDYFKEFLRITHLGPLLAGVFEALGLSGWLHLFANAPFRYDSASGLFLATGSWMNLPAVLITAILTWILVIGIRESSRFNTAMVLVKLAVILLVIGVGAFFIVPENWRPFAPYGWTGVAFFGHTVHGQSDGGGRPLGMLAGAAIMFFSYIGFDSVSTQAEEARNPKRDVPIGIIASLLITTVLYIGIAAVLTGMVPYQEINKAAPVSAAFHRRGIWWAEGLIAVGALTGMTSVLLASMLGQPRILLAMARDGLLPKGFFGAVHPVYRTPWKSTLLTGCFVAVLAAFVPLDVLAELVSIGTLFAFLIVCAAVLIMRRVEPDAHRPFRAPLVPLLPILGIGTCALLMFSLPWDNWVRLILWLQIGLEIYWVFGVKNSVLIQSTLNSSRKADSRPQESRE
jgi:APA family basic amino acid/polyamine antiporter